MSKGHVWTYTSNPIDNSDEEVNHYPCWTVWTDKSKMASHIVDTAMHDITEGFDRGLSDAELMSIRDQVLEFIDKVIGPGRENELTITLDNDGDEEEYLTIHVWSLGIQ